MMGISAIALSFPTVTIETGTAHVVVLGGSTRDAGQLSPPFQTLPIHDGIVQGAWLPDEHPTIALALGDMRLSIVATNEVVRGVRAILPTVTLGGTGAERMAERAFRSVVTVQVRDGAKPYGPGQLNLVYPGMTLTTPLDSSGIVSMLVEDGEHTFCVGRPGLELSASSTIVISADSPSHLKIELHVSNQNDSSSPPPPACAT